VSDAVQEAVTATYRSEWSRIVATLIRITRDWSLAEDSTSEAFESAMVAWARDGIPRNPGAWLTTVAKNRALDRLRRAASLARKLEMEATMLELEELEPDGSGIPDDRLRLIFTCCHPALPAEARIALTLRTVGGLTTPQIAQAFLLPESAIAQRIVRAKRKIADAGIPYRVPDGAQLQERLAGVLSVLYLAFSTGYSAATDELLAGEAIRMTRVLAALMPDEPEVLGLLSLMLFQHSRRNARRDATGALLSIEEQDRAEWDATLIAEGRRVLAAAARRERPGAYQLQAAMAAVHATAPSAGDTDWASIVLLYDRLMEIAPTYVVEFNRAIAVGMADGPDAGLAAIATIAGDLGHLRPAARADLLHRAGRLVEAAAEYRQAVELAPSEAERDALARRLAQIDPANDERGR
jgi:RNA polymerase sigma-70 factor (ECF subfamily)